MSAIWSSMLPHFAGMKIEVQDWEDNGNCSSGDWVQFVMMKRLRGRSSYIVVCQAIWSPRETLQWHMLDHVTKSWKVYPTTGSMWGCSSVRRPALLTGKDDVDMADSYLSWISGMITEVNAECDSIIMTDPEAAIGSTFETWVRVHFGKSKWNCRDKYATNVTCIELSWTLSNCVSAVCSYGYWSDQTHMCWSQWQRDERNMIPEP
jgi:hypothetical protein